MAIHGWKFKYEMGDAMEPEIYQNALTEHRQFMRELMRKRRQQARETAERMGNANEPPYPAYILNAMERWINAHLGGTFAEVELAEAVSAMRKYARADYPADYDVIQSRGTAKVLRLMGFSLRRSAAGMVVMGLWIK